MDATAKPDLHLVYTSDANYLFLTAVSACSAFAQASDPTRLAIHVLDCGISDDAWEAWRADMVRRTGSERFHRHAVDVARFEGLPPWKGSIATYARLCPPELLPDLDWCVYADGDTLFVDDPLGLIDFFDPSVGLWAYGWSSQDSTSTQGASRCRQWCAQNGLEDDFPVYVCAGFLVCNLRWMREVNFTEACFNFLRRYERIPYIDEMTINYICRGHISLLPCDWGVFSMHACERLQPKCIHYISEPLRALRFSPKVGYRDVIAVWVTAAKALLGCGTREACGVPEWKWMLGRLYTRCLGASAAVVQLMPGGGQIGAVKVLNWHRLRGQIRRLLSRRVWQKGMRRSQR